MVHHFEKASFSRQNSASTFLFGGKHPLFHPKKKKKKLRLRGIRNKGKEGKKKFCTKEMGSQNPITTPKPSGSELSGAQKLRQKELIGTT